MNTALYRIWLAIWHLLPANPILVRVVNGASKRVRHLWLRFAYLGALFVVVGFSLFSSVQVQHASLADLAKGASQTFKILSMTQLALMCFLAPAFTAAAITQERDAQTYNILLSTPLTSAQIVFGSLMSRLYFVIMLLVAGLPIFLMTMLYGGVTSSQVFESFTLSACTAFVTGALAIFIAMIGVGTRRTIFSFYLVIALYLAGIWMLGYLPQTWVEASAPNLDGRKMSWLTCLHPFLALDVSLNRVYAPDESYLTDYSAISRYALAYPSAFYTTWTLLLSLALTSASILFVRSGAKQGEPRWYSNVLGVFRRKAAGERTRQPRSVWANPVAWREARTRAVGGGAVRWLIILAGFAASMVLFFGYIGGSLNADDARKYLAYLITVQFALVMVVATNTSATSMTKEKESKTMDILLTTPLTSRYILFGKLRGLVSFAAPLLAGPIVALIAFGLIGLVKKSNPPAPPAIWIETALLVAVLMVIYIAIGCVIGLRTSLNTRKNVTAIMYSVGLMILLCGGASGLAMAFVEAAGNEIGGALAAFSPFTSVYYLVDQAALFPSNKEFVAGATGARAAVFVGSIFAAVLYSFIVYSVYTSLVRNFDMIVRKQSGQ